MPPEERQLSPEERQLPPEVKQLPPEVKQLTPEVRKAGGGMKREQQQQAGSGFTAAFKRAEQEARIRSSHVGIPAHSAQALPKSGIQPDASGKVRCPYCHRPYAFSMALLNRQLRCSGCRSTFRVAEDRRSFKLQAGSESPSPEAGTVSKVARSAIRDANVNLNEAAAAAMRALSKQDRPAPPGSYSALHTAVRASSAPSTRSIPRRSKSAALTGEGLAEGRRRSRLFTVAVGLTLAAVVAGWFMLPDGRSQALQRFQSTHSLASQAKSLHDNIFQGSIEAIVDLDNARFERSVPVDITPLLTSLSGMRMLQRGVAWVETTRYGEATALISGVGTFQDMTTKCSKAGIRLRSWQEVVAACETGQSGAATGILRTILESLPPRDQGFDPLALIDAGHLPTHIEVTRFSGLNGSMLQASGPPRHPTPYHGRLLEFKGTGWPEGYIVFDLTRAAPP